MPPTPVVVVFTARPIEEILQHGGSRDWRLDPERARRAEYLVCTHNGHNPAFRASTAAHRAATLIGRITDVVPSAEAPNRWQIKIDEYIALTPAIPNIWGKSGHLRSPVWYTTLEELGIDLSVHPPFRPMPSLGGVSGMSERPAAPVIPSPDWMQSSEHARPRGGQDSWDRLDAILGQIDRIPDRPEPFDPLDWDQRGLPR